MNRFLTLVFILLFLGLSIMADTHFVQRDWLIFFSYGLTLTMCASFIVRGLSKRKKLSLAVAALYAAALAAACLFRIHAFDFLLSRLYANDLYNHLLQWMKSPVPLMLIIAASTLYQKEKTA